MRNTCRRIMSGNGKTPSHCINSVIKNVHIHLVSHFKTQFFTAILKSLVS